MATLTESEKLRVPKLRLAMKNAVFHYLQLAKKRQKINSLVTILEKAAYTMQRKKREIEESRAEQKVLPLFDRLETLN